MQADSNGRLFPISYPGGNITAMFEADGTGRFGDALSFSRGTIRMYQNPTNLEYGGTKGIYGANLGNLIASFDVLGGGGDVDASGSPTASGQVNVLARVNMDSLMPGYFFRGDGSDLWDKTVVQFRFANANVIGLPNAFLVDEVACQYAGFTGPGCNGTEFANAPGEYFFVGNNGQFIVSEVPEPGSLALFGIAMLGAGIVGRKRAAQS
ncbi:flocculation-associated PEP-CTERM protein PepA [Massilia sp. Dwa41.01b]|uniref:flocculation-associated PEP-CTERM protein PepA n=1 Tax=unclassified Massilia TaxID=2609279 RepID=UPI0016010BCA|nr:MULTISPECIES: flocculation-associated PEP-CTERM protein PepA [unclassified Massilia]QNA88027.1 flocculation-associated PEP-CTERM protein PepA [Massilia sp. Dwa41.01b]QNA98929.1 flocculation-associated PEP-CTERM protein PepA [Massilia sp. Se16.2.3]